MVACTRKGTLYITSRQPSQISKNVHACTPYKLLITIFTHRSRSEALISLVRRKHQLRSKTCKRSKPTTSRFFKGRKMVPRMMLGDWKAGGIRQHTINYPESAAPKDQRQQKKSPLGPTSNEISPFYIGLLGF